MTNIAKPIIKQIKDNREALDYFENILLPAEDEKTQEIIANFQTDTSAFCSIGKLQ